MTSVEARENPVHAWENLNAESVARTKPTLKPWDFVRISKYCCKFKRGYTPNYTSEVFVVTDVLKTTPVTYRIAEIRNADKIIGTFYPEELSLFKQTAKNK